MVRGGEKINQFALVIYMPDPLARFLDDLRVELVTGCLPRAHVTVLPPRPLEAAEPALEQARIMTAEFVPFEIEAGDIEIFPRTNVIYLGVRRGAGELRAMHAAMNSGALYFDEPYAYHPHITLAQEFDLAETGRLEALARERWSGYGGPRSLRTETVAFVQNTAGNCWLDLAGFGLGAALMEPRR